MSPQINELATALAKAQGSIQPAIKDKKNPHFKSSYADLASVWDACRSSLSANGLAVIQTVETRTDIKESILVTTLAHSSGQWMRSEMPIITNKMDPQGIGSALTYYRRYSLASMVGVAPEDDDAEAAQNRGRFDNIKAAPQAETVSKSTADDLCLMLKSCSPAFQEDIKQFCKKYNVDENMRNLPAHLCERLTKSISRNLEECKAALQPQAMGA